MLHKLIRVDEKTHDRVRQTADGVDRSMASLIRQIFRPKFRKVLQTLAS